MPRIRAAISLSRRPARLASLALALVVGLAACNTPTLNEPTNPVQRGQFRQPAPAAQAQVVAPAVDPLGRPAQFNAVRVAILAPLTGQGSEAGTALLRAAQMAVLDNAPDNFVLLPFDTGGTALGAGTAADDALAAGAQLIIGPLFSRSVPQVAARAAGYGVNVVSFSNDARVAGGNVLVMGLLPGGQVDRIFSYAASQGFRNIAVLAPANDYGQAIVTAAQQSATLYGIRLVQSRLVDPGGSFDSAVESLSVEPVLDAVLLAEGGLRLREAAGFFGFYELADIQLLGTSAWNDPSLQVERALDGGWYPTTDPVGHGEFIAQYQEAFGETPPAIASLAYDAASLAGALARDIGPQRFSAPALRDPVGFAGIDGVFRFTADGLTQRGLAVMELRPIGPVVRDQAPTSFAAAGS